MVFGKQVYRFIFNREALDFLTSDNVGTGQMSTNSKVSIFLEFSDKVMVVIITHGN